MSENQQVAGAQLRSIVERVERLEEEKREVADQIKEVLAEAKANGFDTRTIRTVVKRRRMASQEKAEADSMLELYESAIEGAPA